MRYLHISASAHALWVCVPFPLSLSWCIWLFQKVSGSVHISPDMVGPVERDRSLSGNSVSPRLPHGWAVNQPVSLTAQQQNLLLPTHPITSAATLLWRKTVEGLMHAFDREGRCLCEWSWHLSEWVMAMLLYVFCQETFKAYTETVKRTYWLQAVTRCTRWLPIFHLSETL